MIRLHDKKIVTAGEYREVRTYPTLHSHGSSTLARGARTGSATPTIKEKDKASGKKRRSDNVKRAKNKIKYLIHANTTAVTPIFVTLTYRDNVQDRSRAQTDIHAFFRKLRALYPGIQYLYVFEKQRRGAYHAHMVIFTHSFIPFETLENCWTFGSTNVRRIRDTTHIANYLGKYLSKEDRTDLGTRQYSRSKNLRSEEVEYALNALKMSDCWRLQKTSQYGTFNGTFTISIYTYENSG